MSSHFLTRLGQALIFWATSCVGAHRPVSFRFPYLDVFPFILLHLPWISFVLFLYDRRTCTHLVDPSLPHFLGEFPAWYPMLWSHSRCRDAEMHVWSKNLQISALTGAWTSDLGSPAVANVTTRPPRMTLIPKRYTSIGLDVHQILLIVHPDCLP